MTPRGPHRRFLFAATSTGARRLILGATLAAALPRCGPGRGVADGGPRADAAPDARDAREVGARDGYVDAGGADSGRDATRHADAAHDGRDGAHDAPTADVGEVMEAATADVFTATSIVLSPPLTPSFSPSIHDYYIRCTGPTTPVEVTMTAATGATVALTHPTRTTPASARDITLEVASGDAIVIDVTAGAATSTYWVRCLPPDFPRLSMTLHPEAGAPLPGYYLVGDVSVNDLADAGYATVLDTQGVPVWFHRTATDREPINVDCMEHDTLSFVPYTDYTLGDVSTRYEVHDLDTTGGPTFVAPVGAPLDMHELRLLPSGHSLVLADPISTGVDLTGLAGLGPNENMVECVIQELDATGAVAWTWSASDHFDPVQVSTYPVKKSVGATPIVVTYHCNSLDVTPSGDVLVSARSMDSVFLVSRASGKVLWKLGGAAENKDGAPYIAVVGDPFTSFYRQHDARFQPDGTVSLFDDHTGEEGPARAVVYALDLAAGTATPVWQYLGGAPSASMGSFRILADGSRVVGWGQGGVSDRAFTEVDDAGRDLLDFGYPDGQWSFRAVKVPTSELTLAVLRSSAGAP